MSFQDIPQIESSEFYLDLAFRRAKEVAIKAKKIKQRAADTFVDKIKTVEIAKLNTIYQVLRDSLGIILFKFPSIDGMPSFYRALVGCTMEYSEVKIALGSLKWAVTRLSSLKNIYSSRVRLSRDMGALGKHSKEFYGRTASVMKQMDKHFNIIRDARKILIAFPVVKTGMKTVVIAGMPNVGKSTLLSTLTGSKPKIAHYPFTTKQLMIGYDGDVQYIDTPGLLDRPLSKRNKIEQQAILALKHVASVVVFIIDPTEYCGYPVKDQLSLLSEIKKLLSLPVIAVANKADAVESSLKALSISAEKKTGIDELKKEILKYLKQAE